MVEAAREQDLLHQLVDLGEVAHDFGMEVRPGLGEPELDRHAHSRERRAQFMARIGEQRLLGAEQFLDARRQPR